MFPSMTAHQYITYSCMFCDIGIFIINRFCITICSNKRMGPIAQIMYVVFVRRFLTSIQLEKMLIGHFRCYTKFIYAMHLHLPSFTWIIILMGSYL